jgi:hypothetical protein
MPPKKRQKTNGPGGGDQSDKALNQAFAIIDADSNGFLEIDEFVKACEQLGFLDDPGARRLFAAADTGSGQLNLAEFRRVVRRRRIFQAIVSDLTKETFEVREDYDCTKTTSEAYQHPAYRAAAVAAAERSCDGGNAKSEQKEYEEAKHGKLVGEYAEIRRTLDYNYHKNFSEERQLWQDNLVKGIAQTQDPEQSPWLVFTCGAMGAGKGYTMSWMSNGNIFPLERVAHIDPDMCKQAMPEWSTYLKYDKEHSTKDAGSMCHKESGLLQELAQELALCGGGNVWVDGSLQNSAWYRDNVIPGVRKRFPQYRIALFHVHCELETLRQRANDRGKATGRYIPEDVLERSWHLTKQSVKDISPLADFVVSINNEGRTPYLDYCLDHSHSFAAVRQRFSPQAPQAFPQALPPMYLASVSVTLHAKQVSVKSADEMLRLVRVPVGAALGWADGHSTATPSSR